jgi:hypothetical protein
MIGATTPNVHETLHFEPGKNPRPMGKRSAKIQSKSWMDNRSCTVQATHPTGSEARVGQAFAFHHIRQRRSMHSHSIHGSRTDTVAVLPGMKP